MRNVFVMCVCVGHWACGGGNDDSGGNSGNLPDISGDYQVMVNWVTGCDGDPGIVEDWAQGPLSIEGSPSNLSFDFGDDMDFSGTVSASGSVWFSGVVTNDSATLDLGFSGTADQTDDQWVVLGELEIVVEDDEFTSNNCSVTSEIEAFELVGVR